MLLALSVLLSSLCLVLVLQQQRMLTQLHSELQAAPVQTAAQENKAMEFTTRTTEYGITLSYPKDWYLVKVENEFMPQSPMVRLTSNRGQMRLGTQGNTDVYFDNGYQLLITRLAGNDEYSEYRTEPTNNPQVVSLVETCDGPTCPDAQYLLNRNGNRYLVQTWYRFQPYQQGIELNDRIIDSLH